MAKDMRESGKEGRDMERTLINKHRSITGQWRKGKLIEKDAKQEALSNF